MTFKIEFSDTQFRLVIVTGGEEDFPEAVLYCSVSSVVGSDGKVYGAYLNGSEPDLDKLASHPDDVEMVTTSIKVYELTQWPTLRPIDAPVTLVDTEFEGEEDDEDEDVVDVVPIA